MRAIVTGLIAVVSLCLLQLGATAQQTALAASMQADIDKAVADALAHTGAPSASIAIVRDAQIVYERAYGSARLDPALAATPSMRYSIGSISKQFTATAMLLLAEQEKLSLDDRVSRFLPDLTRAREVTIRQILSMTSGYQDYWPQDYVMPPMLQPTTAQAILDRWAKKPLDFEPGTKWQYSNTNYVAAGTIVEKAAGQPLLDVLRAHVFAPLGMKTVSNVDVAPLGPADPAGYMRYAIGPLRPAPKEGKGWLFAAGELAMTPHDLALWDVGMIDQTILKPASYAEQQRETVLKEGVGTGYGLGVSVGTLDGHRRIWHNGEVSGFTAENDVFPDDRIAVVVFTNLDATRASGTIGGRIASLLFATSDPGTELALQQASRIFAGLRDGKIDRSLFTANCNAYFSDRALADFSSSVKPLGAPVSFTPQGQSLRGGMIFRSYLIRFPQKTLRLTTFTMPDGKLEQYLVAAVE